MMRVDGRGLADLRPVSFQKDIQRHADGSILISFGDTKVICSASIETSVPYHAKMEGKGWLTAEYSMLPGSTYPRAQRETKGPKGRSQEIQRLIGRALRNVVDLSKMPERSIYIDCDVLQADGGTRTASITGAYVALAMAVRKGQKDGRLPNANLLTGQVAAVSCGLLSGEVYVDMCYAEDSKCDVDCNLVMTSEGRLVEIQGTAEKTACTVEQWQQLTNMGCQAIHQLVKLQKNALA